MRITRTFIEKGVSDRGGWNKPQVLALGLTWPLEQGWMESVIGREISDENARTFMEKKNWLAPATKKKYRKLYHQAVRNARRARGLSD